MRYRVLGTTQALNDDGTPVALGGARLRALLAVLALRPGRTVPVGVLVDEVWDGDPPADAVGAVQALVGRLRRTLGHAAVASADGGYRLCAEGEDVDLHRFERLAGEGARALEEGDAVKAAALLDDALGLWQGPVLADLPLRTAESARWEARRLDARGARLAAALALGRAEEALPELVALCGEHPLDERLQALRLRALRAAGRSAEALAAYEEIRADLADRLGADPGRELRMLHAELLRPDFSPTPPLPEPGAAPQPPPGPAQESAPGPAGLSDPGLAPGTAPLRRSAAEEARGAPAGHAVGEAGASGVRAPGLGPGSEATGEAWAGERGPGPRPGEPVPPRSGEETGPGAPAGDAVGEAGASGVRAPGLGPGSEATGEAWAGERGPGPRPGEPVPPRSGEETGPGAPAGDAVGEAGASGVRAQGLGPGSEATGEAWAGDRGPGPRPGEPVPPRSGEETGPGAPAGDAVGEAGASGVRAQGLGPGSEATGEAWAGDRGPGPRPGESFPPRSGEGAGSGVAPVSGRGGVGESRPRAGNLRARLTSFVGRDADIRTIHADLTHSRLVTLLGPGGAGKTRLSQEAAERAAEAWPDGVWLAELAPVDDPETVPDAVLTALGARETVLRGAGAEELRAAERHGDDPLARLTEHCSRRRMLLLLDNCEHVVGAAATLAERLLESCPAVTVLATSREPLGVPGELVRPVDPLPDPMALQLLADRGAAARPGFRIEDDPDAADEICRRLDGLPLAIELAAARLRMLTPRQIADRLDDRFRLLTSGSRTVLPRQQTLRAVVDWSWDLLEDTERAVLRRLSVFAGGCDITAAEAVCGATALDVLGSLIDKSLVVAAPTPDDRMRYRLLETVAEYAAERLDEAGERDAVERRHLLHYRELARTTDPLLRGHGQRAAIALLQREYENLRTALRRAAAARDEQELLCLVLSLSWYWQMRDLRTEARHWASAAGALGPDPFRAPVEPAPPIFERCTDAPPPMSPELLQEARRSAGLIRMVFMEYNIEEWTAPDRTEWLRGVTRAYHPGLPQTCRPPASLWFFAVLLTGNEADLRELLDETVNACRAYGYEWELAAALQARANVLANRTQWAGDATRDAEESLELFTRLGDAWGAAEALSARGEAHERRGEYLPAAEAFTAAIGHAERIGAQAQTAVLRSRLAGILLESGEGDRGEAIIREVLAEKGMGNESSAIARLYLVLWLARSGRVQEARAEITQLLRQFESSTLAIFEGMVIGVQAWLDLMEGCYEQSLERTRVALSRAHDPLARMVAPQLASVHMVTAATALAKGWPERAEDAARVLGAADADLPPGHFRPLYESESRAEAEEAVRALLDDAAYEAAYAEGGGLTFDEAAALVQVP
ncbi:BTAD domain-containing putative transcriptional regulator [Streptomyces sp. CA-135486]|uniref:BTAD domain-containing putative transcriptional regulator n=1 Tax=Streptomyces sp. CA-135486 TaxID=3240049 RepID=UPI003D910216